MSEERDKALSILESAEEFIGLISPNDLVNPPTGAEAWMHLKRVSLALRLERERREKAEAALRRLLGEASAAKGFIRGITGNDDKQPLLESAIEHALAAPAPSLADGTGGGK